VIDRAGRQPLSRREQARISVLAISLLGSLALWLLPVASADQAWQPGPGAADDNTIDGSVDLPGDTTVSTSGSFQVAGWLVDRSADGWSGIDQVQVYNGQMDSGGTALASATVGLNRPDVGAALANPYWSASGFTADVPGAAVQPGVTTLYVYAHTPARGWWYQPIYVSASSLELPGAPVPAANGFPSVTISAPASGEHIPWTRGTYTLYGSAADPRAGRANGSGIDRVTVYFYGDEHDPNRIFVGNATIDGTTWSLDFVPKNFPTGHPQMYVYARSSLTGRESSASTSLYLDQNQ
jgi:hypothetical protein